MVTGEKEVTTFGSSGEWQEVPDMAGKTGLLSSPQRPYRFAVSSTKPAPSFLGDKAEGARIPITVTTKLWAKGVDAPALVVYHYDA